MAVDRLFVYGTLAPGRVNEHILADVPGEWLPASVRGHLRSAGWGAELGYPAMTPDDSADPIQGFVFVSTDLHRHWDRLDAFEGEAYRRQTVSAQLASGETVEAYVYALAVGGSS